MGAIRRFGATLLSSIYSPPFDTSILARSGGGALDYVLVLSLAPS